MWAFHGHYFYQGEANQLKNGLCTIPDWYQVDYWFYDQGQYAHTFYKNESFLASTANPTPIASTTLLHNSVMLENLDL